MCATRSIRQPRVTAVGALTAGAGDRAVPWPVTAVAAFLVRCRYHHQLAYRRDVAALSTWLFLELSLADDAVRKANVTMTACVEARQQANLAHEKLAAA